MNTGCDHETIRRFALSFDRFSDGGAKLTLAPADITTRIWAIGHEAELRRVIAEVGANHPKFARDPEPGDRPPPAGVITPKLGAAMIAGALSRAFPHDGDVFVVVPNLVGLPW